MMGWKKELPDCYNISNILETQIREKANRIYNISNILETQIREKANSIYTDLTKSVKSVSSNDRLTEVLAIDNISTVIKSVTKANTAPMYILLNRYVFYDIFIKKTDKGFHKILISKFLPVIFPEHFTDNTNSRLSKNITTCQVIAGEMMTPQMIIQEESQSVKINALYDIKINELDEIGNKLNKLYIGFKIDDKLKSSLTATNSKECLSNMQNIISEAATAEEKKQGVLYILIVLGKYFLNDARFLNDTSCFTPSSDNLMTLQFSCNQISTFLPGPFKTTTTNQPETSHNSEKISNSKIFWFDGGKMFSYNEDGEPELLASLQDYEKFPEFFEFFAHLFFLPKDLKTINSINNKDTKSIMTEIIKNPNQVIKALNNWGPHLAYEEIPKNYKEALDREIILVAAKEKAKLKEAFDREIILVAAKEKANAVANAEADAEGYRKKNIKAAINKGFSDEQIASDILE